MSQTITDTARYSFHVTWSPEDAEFIATCVEFPSLSWLAGTPEKALTGLRIVVDEVVDDMRANDEPVPEPLSTRHYSGKFQLRLGEDLHRRLVIEAAEQQNATEMIRRLVRGKVFRKLNRMGVAKLRYVWCSPDLSKMMWGDPPSGGVGDRAGACDTGDAPRPGPEEQPVAR